MICYSKTQELWLAAECDVIGKGVNFNETEEAFSISAAKADDSILYFCWIISRALYLCLLFPICAND